MSLSDAECVYNITISLFPYLETYQLFCLNSLPVDEVDKDVSVSISTQSCTRSALEPHHVSMWSDIQPLLREIKEESLIYISNITHIHGKNKAIDDMSIRDRTCYNKMFIKCPFFFFYLSSLQSEDKCAEEKETQTQYLSVSRKLRKNVLDCNLSDWTLRQTDVQ